AHEILEHDLPEAVLDDLEAEVDAVGRPAKVSLVVLGLIRIEDSHLDHLDAVASLTERRIVLLKAFCSRKELPDELRKVLAIPRRERGERHAFVGASPMEELREPSTGLTSGEDCE